jgi:hypothetical protein
MPSESAYHRLAFIRYLFGLGMNQASSPSPLSSAAILTLHDSVELFLHLSLEEHNVGKNKPQFMEYFSLINEAISPNKLSQQESMRRLNSSRVSLKHHGIMPSQLDIDAFKADVQLFFAINTPLIFGIELSTVSRTHLVELQATRDALLDADIHISGGDYDNALNSIALAFARELSYRQIPQSTGFLRIPRIKSANADQVKSVVEALCHSVTELSQDVALLSNGIDLKRLHVFRSITPIVHLLNDGNATYVYKSLPPATIASVQYCYDYVIDTALLLQQKQVSINTLFTS